MTNVSFLDNFNKNNCMKVLDSINSSWCMDSCSGIKPKSKMRMELSLKSPDTKWLNLRYTYLKHLPQNELVIATDQTTLTIKVTRGSILDEKIVAKFMNFA